MVVDVIADRKVKKKISSHYKVGEKYKPRENKKNNKQIQGQ